MFATFRLPASVEKAMEPIGTIIMIFKNRKYTVYIIKKPQIMTMTLSSAASISMISPSPNPKSFMTSACALSMVSVVYPPADSAFTRFPIVLKNAFMIVTLFATSHSEIPSRISIRRITSKRISSRTSTLSAQNPITKNSTTREEPTATKIGSTLSTNAHGPPPLKFTGDCPNRANTRFTWLFQNPNTISRSASILSPNLKIST